MRSNQFGFNIKWAGGALVFVEAYTDLRNYDSRMLVSTNYLPDSGTVYFSDPTWTNYPARFYRVW